ncbi:MAG TPA: hypothetical protein VIL36_07430 [Acidimicrobiales bacterium]
MLLRIAMALAILPAAFFATTIQLGVARNDDTLETVARDATEGITVAQAIKLSLAELDELVVRDLVDDTPLGSNGYPANYDRKRTEVHDNLVRAAVQSSANDAYVQPLANIEYALAHYHTLVKEAFAADARGDERAAVDAYQRANQVMEGTLFGEADFIDKANTYVLNDTYDRQQARTRSTIGLIAVSWVGLIGFLVVLQLLLARAFRRLVNPPLLVATVLTVFAGAFALARLDSSAHHLTAARLQAFDSVQVLARARAKVVSARQAQGHLLFDPGRGAEAEAQYQSLTEELFRVQDRDRAVALAQISQGANVPEGAGGMLAQAAVAGANRRDEMARRTVVALGDFLAADRVMRQLLDYNQPQMAVEHYRRGLTFSQITSTIAEAQLEKQAMFDGHARSAAAATARLDRIAVATAVAVLALAGLGLYVRLREYGA